MIMATINDKLTYLTDTKAAIKQAIIAKGVSVPDSDTFRSYASKIEAIQAGGSTTFPNGIKFGYSNFTEAPMFDTSEMTDMSNMFNNCTSLTTVPLFNTSNANNMNSMFNFCSKLTTVPQFNTSKVSGMGFMFSYCSSLTNVPLFDTANVKNIGGMFNNCTSLTTVPLFNTSKADSMLNMFSNCKQLTTLGGFTGLKLNLDLGYSSKLTVESVMNVITNAADMTSSPRTLTLHANVYAKLNEEQIATATAKGWNIAEK